MTQGALPERICRFYFKQLLSALHYMHTNGKVHRDLKLDNLLLDKDFRLIVADLGFTAPVEGRTPEGFLQTKRGTPIYLAPEVHAGIPYRGQHVDLFAASICLFNMMT